MKEWISRFKRDFSQDDIIFGEDDEIHEGVKLDSSEAQLPTMATTISKESSK